MVGIITALLGAIPTILTSVQQLIARGRVTGELSDTDADALTAKANAIFALYSQPAPPPPMSV